TLASTVTINAPSASVPQGVSEGTLASSWNYTIPGALMQPGLRVLADVDPANAVAESSDGDNSFPSSGTPLALDVRTVPALSLRYVPVLQSVNGKQGGVTSGNAGQYATMTQQVYPVGTVDVDVRAPFTTNAPALQADDGNGAWGQILSEVNALRTADGSSRYYMGIVKVGYSSGIAGLGYIGGRTSVGWDYLPSASEVIAHEIGHNFGRYHAPGCGAGNPDPSYPYAGGTIGAYGYDASLNKLLAPGAWYDLMSYCDSTWISDYSYAAVLAHRAANPFIATQGRWGGGMAVQRGLLVWGRVQRGQLILEPTFEVDAPPALPPRPGPHRVQGFGAAGEVLFDLSFAGDRVGDHPDATAEQFAFVVPYGMMQGKAPVRVRATGGGRQAELVAAPLASGAPRGAASGAAEVPEVRQVQPGVVRVHWTSPGVHGVLVRDARTGAILAFA
ncbi:MAG TPA: zinc-dependent metalloprotease family protein, partial [Gemmatimonadaceae bacterium]|nr:zinc-dependent metalloprotease family protein [Gemmatimonadaceae bacterium]